MPDMKLKDKIAIVTGSSRGIGKAIAKAYAREGATVIVAARTEQAGGRLPGTIHQTVEEIVAFGGKAVPIRTDVGDEASIEAMVKQTLDTFGRIDILYNNAGILFNSMIADTTLKRWELVMRVNVTGTFLCSRAVIPAMTAQRSGSIINMSSVAASSTIVGGVHYAVSKAAIERFTFGLAEEVRGANIAVNVLTPGLIKTEAAELLMPISDWTGWESPEVVGPPAVFLAAQTAETFTGRLVHTEEWGKTWP
jgi:NAD(P)-dependent dehydrogenase (short-subunit alcohol dehydrogenase family)